jgi:hypothetical protein
MGMKGASAESRKNKPDAETSSASRDRSVLVFFVIPNLFRDLSSGFRVYVLNPLDF